jgi:hypothetical protein
MMEEIRSSEKCSLHEPHGFTSQRTAFFKSLYFSVIWAFLKSTSQTYVMQAPPAFYMLKGKRDWGDMNHSIFLSSLTRYDWCFACGLTRRRVCCARNAATCGWSLCEVTEEGRARSDPTSCSSAPLHTAPRSESARGGSDTRRTAGRGVSGRRLCCALAQQRFHWRRRIGRSDASVM